MGSDHHTHLLLVLAAFGPNVPLTEDPVTLCSEPSPLYCCSAHSLLVYFTICYHYGLFCVIFYLGQIEFVAVSPQDECGTAETLRHPVKHLCVRATSDEGFAQ